MLMNFKKKKNFNIKKHFTDKIEGDANSRLKPIKATLNIDFKT